MASAVNSPTGMYLRLKNASKLVVSRSTPRSNWYLGWAVCSTRRPRVGSTMAVVTSA